MGVDLNLNSTLSPGLSAEMKTTYDKLLLKNAKPVLVHAQFAVTKNIPKNGGKTLEMRRFSTLPKALLPITEGVTPKGNSLSVSTVLLEINQYGDYIATTDVLDYTAIDNNIVQATEQLANQSGETLDRLTANVINAGTNVQYVNGKIARSGLTSVDILTVDEIKKAVRTLKRFKSKKIKNDYVAIIHPDVSYDLTADPKWENVKTYSDPKDIYSGEIGRLYGVRFVETTEAMVFFGDIVAGIKSLTVDHIDGNKIYVYDSINTTQATSLSSKSVVIKGKKYTISSATAGNDGQAYLTMLANVPTDIVPKTTIYGGSGASDGRPVYSTLILGDGAYGMANLESGGLKTIVKQLGSAGTADPLDQRSTVGWKAFHGAVILTQENMVRIESCSSNEATVPTN